MIRLTLKKMAGIAAGFIGSALVLCCLAVAPEAAAFARATSDTVASSQTKQENYSAESKRVREIKYVGIDSFSAAEFLDRLKHEKVGLLRGSQYDPTKTRKVEAIIKQLEAEHGHRSATVVTKVRNIPPQDVEVTFVVSEGPKGL